MRLRLPISSNVAESKSNPSCVWCSTSCGNLLLSDLTSIAVWFDFYCCLPVWHQGRRWSSQWQTTIGIMIGCNCSSLFTVMWLSSDSPMPTVATVLPWLLGRHFLHGRRSLLSSQDDQGLPQSHVILLFVASKRYQTLFWHNNAPLCSFTLSTTAVGAEVN